MLVLGGTNFVGPALVERAIAAGHEVTLFNRGISRCHAILGPRDDGAAYHYWLRRLATTDEVLAPGSGSDTVQYADVRDVAGWIVNCVETGRRGVHNLTGPQIPWTLRDFLETSRAAVNGNATLTWVDADYLRKEVGLQSFSDLPLWAPHDEDEGVYQVDGARALRAGMSYRPLTDTARDAWRW